MWAQDRAQNYLEKQDFQVYQKNKRVCGVEVDLILKKDIFYFVEVKSIRNFDEVAFRVSIKQRKRLLHALHLFRDFNDTDVELLFAFVNSKDSKVLVLRERDLPVITWD